MKDDGFKFSHDKRLFFGKIGFDYFLDVSKRLDAVVRANREDVETRFLTCEDEDTYNWCKISVVCDLLDRALKNRKSYSLDEYNRDIWDRSFKSQLTIRASSSKDSFMIALSCDIKDPKRIIFYGQDIDEGTLKSVRDNFEKGSLIYRLGEGFSRPTMDDYWRNRGALLDQASIRVADADL